LMYSRISAHRELQGKDGDPDGEAMDTDPNGERFLGRTAKDSAQMTTSMNARNKAFWENRQKS
jgi:hypothetical protein